MQLDIPRCFERRCKHFKGVKEVGGGFHHVNYCSAFPDGIPDDIAYGENKHSVPMETQGNNIVFEEQEEE